MESAPHAVGLQRAKIDASEESAQSNQRASVYGNLSAIRYGWCPFKDIDLRGPLGLDTQVGHVLMERGALIAFTNVEYQEIDPLDVNTPNGAAPRMMAHEKFARACAEEIEASYSGWGFMLLHPLTGLSLEAAFEIFRVVQPFAYLLTDDKGGLDAQLQVDALERIAGAGFDSDTEQRASGVLQLMQIGARRAYEKAEGLKDELKKEMAAYVGSKQGKYAPDSLDLHAFALTQEAPPSKIQTLPANSTDPDIKSLLAALTTKMLSDEQATNDQLGVLLAELQAERDSRRELEEKVNQIVAMGNAKVKQKPAPAPTM